MLHETQGSYLELPNNFALMKKAKPKSHHFPGLFQGPRHPTKIMSHEDVHF